MRKVLLTDEQAELINDIMWKRREQYFKRGTTPPRIYDDIMMAVGVYWDEADEEGKDKE